MPASGPDHAEKTRGEQRLSSAIQSGTQFSDHGCDRPVAEMGPALGNENVDGRLIGLNGSDRLIHVVAGSEVFERFVVAVVVRPSCRRCTAGRF